MSSVVKEETRRITQEVNQYRAEKMGRLKNLDLFILDNSIRESTVGQLRSHTVENKKAIFAEVKKCGLEHIIVASFSHMTRVDDDFCQYLVDSGENFTNLYSFSEVTKGLKNGRYDTESVPISLLKNKKYGLRNTIFELDLANPDCKWGDTWTVQDHCQLLLQWIRWTKAEIHKDARVLINLRDFAASMSRAPERVLEIVEFVASLPPYERLFGILYEDLGDSLPQELGMWTESVRKVMDLCGWTDGRLLIHVHQQWDLQTASALDCLSNGADGVWASICEEGAAVGHACSSVTVMNLVRLGNKKVLKNFNCLEMRNAARAVTKVTTGMDPHPKQVLYGDRALDMVFGFPLQFVREFDMAKFFDVKPVVRMNTLVGTEMIRDRLIEVFGWSKAFTLEIAAEMKEKMLDDLREGRKEEYMSEVGLALLFDRAGGKLTEKMKDVIASVEIENYRHEELVAQIRKLCDTWDLQDEVQDDERLEFDSFYHGFMAPYFGCYRCDLTKQGLQCLDMDSNGYVDWKEFLVYINWALRQYPDVVNADELLEITFQKGLIPSMRDEQVKNI